MTQSDAVTSLCTDTLAQQLRADLDDVSARVEGVRQGVEERGAALEEGGAAVIQFHARLR